MNDFNLKRVDELLEDYGNNVVNEMKTYLSFTTNLKSSIKSSAGDGILTISMAGHGLYVNDGRKPNSKMPPAKPISDWMKSKGIPESALYPIRRKIAKDGIQPRPFFHYFTDNINQLYKDIAVAVGEDVIGIISDNMKRVTN